MTLFSKARQLVRKVETNVGLKDEKKKPAPYVNPDPINPLTGQPVSQNIPMSPTAGPMQGLGQMSPAYLPSPVSMAQRVPQGLGSDVFRSTIAPLQQQNYGLGQIDPRFLQGQMRLPGGSNAGVPFTPAMQQDIPAQVPMQGLGMPFGNFRMFQ